LILSCFRGTVAAKANNLQKQLQRTEFVSQLDNQQQIQKLNNLDAQAWLYIGILERLSTNKAGSNIRIAKTIEALKQKKSEVLDELEPRRPEKYRTLARVQKFLETITLSKAQKDFIEIEEIINRLIWTVKNSQPSETIIQGLIERLSIETVRKSDRISPDRLRLMYKIAELMNDISMKEISQFSNSQLEDINKSIINELNTQKNILSKGFNKLLKEKHEMQERIETYSESLNRLNRAISERESELKVLREELEKYTRLNRDTQNQISNLNRELVTINQKLLNLESQKDSLRGRINQLTQDIIYKQNEIDTLNNKLNKYSQIKILKGEYIGNLSNKTTKYHFNQKCPDWKMLVGEYVLRLDGSREIISSNSPTVFITQGLEACDVCSGRRSSRRRTL
jgi:uncharacterized coiled-coil DUF342 family protein